MYAASSEARNATASAISEASAKRPIGICPVSSASLPGGTDASIRVWALGEMAFTVVPNLASSLAVVLVKPMIPALAIA